MKINFDFKDINNLVKISLVLGALALLVSFLSLIMMRGVVRDEINRATVATKMKIVDLDTAKKLLVIKGENEYQPNYSLINKEISDIKNELVSIYADAKGEAKNDWQKISTALDNIKDKSEKRDKTIFTDIDNLITILRQD